jgi:hypothetical protein
MERACRIGADQNKNKKNNDDIQPTKNDNQLHPEPAEPEQAEPSLSVLVVNPPNITAEATILTQSWWDTGDVTCYFGAIDGEVSPKAVFLHVFCLIVLNETYLFGIITVAL